MLEKALTQPSTYLILAILCGIALYYAFRTVRPLRQRDREHGQTAWLVVVGVAVTGLAYTAILVISSGLLAALEHLALLVICFVVSGIPMIIEYIDDYTTRHQQQARRQSIANISHLIREDD